MKIRVLVPVVAATGVLALLGASSWMRLNAQVEPPIGRPIRPWPPIPPIPPRPWPVPSTSDLELTNQVAHVDIKNGLARTRLTQTFRNNRPVQIEGTYLWALPTGAAPSDFAVTMGGKRIEAEVLDGDKARDIYTSIVAKMRDPAIFEFIDRSLLRAKLFPVPASGEVQVELTYSQPVANNRFSLPLRVPGDKDGAKATVDISLQASDLKAVYSPSHSVEIKRDGDTARISGEFGASDADFSLVWTQGTGRVNAQILAVPGDRFGEKDGFFLLLAAPSSAATEAEVAAKDVVFVFDTSGSMDGEKIEQARRALKTLLASLRPQDRFGVVTFSTDVRPFKDTIAPATAENINAARGFADDLKAVGATNISDALQTAFKMLPTDDATRPRQVVFLTDGLPTVGETNIDALLKQSDAQVPAGTRLFTFGLGYDVNTRLLDTLAEDNRGASDYVAPKEDIEAKVGELYSKIAYPVLTDLKLSWPGTEFYDIYPRTLPDVFRGSQTVVLGRYRGTASPEIALSGQTPRGAQSFDGKVIQAAADDATVKEVPKLWATRKVGFLLDDARRNAHPLSDEARTEVLSLSKKWGIVTPLTAALVTEDEIPVNGGPIPPGMPIPMARAGGGRGGFGGGFGGRGGGFESPGMAAGAAAPMVSGQRAVEAAKATKALRDGVTSSANDATTSTSLKTAGGKSFVLRDGIWTDTDYDAQKSPQPRVIKFASKEYFDLARDSQVAQWLSVGQTVIFVWKGESLKIEG